MEDDEEGEFTYCGPRGESVIDYTIVNTEAYEEVEKLVVDWRIESDQQPLTLYLRQRLGRK